MDHESMDLAQLAAYLHRDVREVTKLANRGHLPGRKVSGQWRFAPAEINYWIETQLPGYSEKELHALEARGPSTPTSAMAVSGLLQESTMAVPLEARTRASVLQELVKLAEQSWQVFDSEALLEAIKQREDMASTAMDNGVAIPHPRRPVPGMIAESIIAYGRTFNGIPFGAGGVLCDLFFLVCCRDQATHLRVLARLSRMLRRPGLIDDLRAADTVTESYQVLEAAERDLIEE